METAKAMVPKQNQSGETSMSHINTFIQANAKAYAKASKVFASIEAPDFLTQLAEAGITGGDIRVYATIYVAEQSGVNPHPSQRGGALTFTKDSAEYNRVKYIVDVATGVRETRAAKKAKQTKQAHARITPEARKAAKAYLAQFDSIEDAIAALRAV
jgi:hypothetical protein